MLEIRERARENIAHQQQRDKIRYDKKHRYVNYDVGAHVKLRTPLRQVGKSDKLQPKYFGPYIITEKRNDLNYVIKPLHGSKVKEDTVHVSRLAPYYDSWIPTP
ncbi:hypothetical protein QE152_g39846 [Popillia japonica]